jgi:hypothetical protein
VRTIPPRQGIVVVELVQVVPIWTVSGTMGMSPWIRSLAASVTRSQSIALGDAEPGNVPASPVSLTAEWASPMAISIVSGASNCRGDRTVSRTDSVVNELTVASIRVGEGRVKAESPG